MSNKCKYSFSFDFLGKLTRNENNVENAEKKSRPNIRHVLWVDSDDKPLKGMHLIAKL